MAISAMLAGSCTSVKKIEMNAKQLDSTSAYRSILNAIQRLPPLEVMKARVCVSRDSCSYFMKKPIWSMHFRVGNPLTESCIRA